MKSIFISHSHSDSRLAERLQSLLEDVSHRKVQIDRSSDPSAIKSGENWRDWINDKVLTCNLAIVLLTPSSFRGRWVLWEAGAVAGVQYERLKRASGDPASNDIKSSDPAVRRVRVLKFNVLDRDLGPFGNTQTVDGLRSENMLTFVSDILEDCLEHADARKAYLTLAEKVKAFVQSAADDLRFTPIEVTEGIVQDWLGRIDERAALRDDAWIIAATRWINVAFLGAGQANAHAESEAIDFRIHVRIAAAHRRQRNWQGVIEQLRLAAKLSPNDMVVLRDLGRAYREMGNSDELVRIMTQMEQLDADVFKRDREGIALRCGYLSGLKNWVKVDELLSAADPGVVGADTYLANWHALAVMKARGPDASLPRFRELKALVEKSGNDFWNRATLVNAHLALDELDEAKALLSQLFKERSPADIQSATRFYDEILTAFGRSLDWRREAGLTAR